MAPAIRRRCSPSLDRRCAQSACRDIHDPQQRNVVVRIHETLRVSEQFLDLAPVEKALSADDAIRDFLRAQIRFEQARLRVHAKKDREILVLAPLDQQPVGDFVHDEFRLLPVIAHLDHAHLRPVARRAPELLRSASRIVFNQRVRGVQDRIR